MTNSEDVVATEEQDESTTVRSTRGNERSRNSRNRSPMQTTIRNPTSEDWEEILSVYALVLYREYPTQTRYMQRSILITTRNAQRLESELDRLMEKILQQDNEQAADPSEVDHTYYYQLVPEEEWSESDPTDGKGFDQVIKAISSPLRIARYSQKAGVVFADSNMQYCPYTRASLTPFIASKSTFSGTPQYRK